MVLVRVSRNNDIDKVRSKVPAHVLDQGLAVIGVPTIDNDHGLL